VEETGVPGENHRPAASHWQTLSQNIVLAIVCKIELCRDVLLKDNEEKKKADDKRPLMLKVYKLVIYSIGHYRTIPLLAIYFYLGQTVLTAVLGILGSYTVYHMLLMLFFNIYMLDSLD
jgi:Na+-transporting NADH:ubiquinone oxidoreductase subunit NqrC